MRQLRCCRHSNRLYIVCPLQKPQVIQPGVSPICWRLANSPRAYWRRRPTSNIERKCPSGSLPCSLLIILSEPVAGFVDGYQREIGRSAHRFHDFVVPDAVVDQFAGHRAQPRRGVVLHLLVAIAAEGDEFRGAALVGRGYPLEGGVLRIGHARGNLGIALMYQRVPLADDDRVGHLRCSTTGVPSPMRRISSTRLRATKRSAIFCIASAFSLSGSSTVGVKVMPFSSIEIAWASTMVSSPRSRISSGRSGSSGRRWR